MFILELQASAAWIKDQLQGPTQHQMLLKERMGTVRAEESLLHGHMIPQRPVPHTWFVSPRVRDPQWADIRWEKNYTVSLN